MNKGRPILSTFVKPINQGPFYIYNRDKTVLLYHSTCLSDLTVELKIPESALNKHMGQGSVYLKNLTLSTSLIPDVSHQLISLADLKNKLSKIREGQKSKIGNR